jgi:sRNA-binding protein
VSNIKQVRDRVWHSFSPQTAAVIGVSLQDLQQFVAGNTKLTDTQLRDLARYLGVTS